MCDPVICTCLDCRNNSAYEVERRTAVGNALARNPHAFVNHVTKAEKRATMLTIASHNHPSNNNNTTKTSSPTTSRGCNCKKSKCLKKYCECFFLNLYCNPTWCKCRDCHNFEGSVAREETLRRKLDDEERERERYEKSRSRRKAVNDDHDQKEERRRQRKLKSQKRSHHRPTPPPPPPTAAHHDAVASERRRREEEEEEEEERQRSTTTLELEEMMNVELEQQQRAPMKLEDLLKIHEVASPEAAEEREEISSSKSDDQYGAVMV